LAERISPFPAPARSPCHRTPGGTTPAGGRRPRHAHAAGGDESFAHAHLAGDNQSNHVVIEKVGQTCVITGIGGTTVTYLGVTDDSVNVAIGSDEVNVAASIGSGSDTLLITGDDSRDVAIETGSGDDVVRALEMVSVRGDLTIDTGAGQDLVRVSEVFLFPGNDLEVNTGSGADLLLMAEIDLTAGNLNIDLGSGIDALIFDDSVSVSPGAAIVDGGSGFDVVLNQSQLDVFPAPAGGPFHDFELVL
jgi:hypothetical protein